MEWYIFAFSCAILTALSSIVEKKTLIKEHAMEFSSVLAIFNFILSVPLIKYADFSKIYSVKMLLILYFVSLIGSIAFLFVAKSIRHMDISIVSPLLNFNPAVVAILAFVFLGERLSFAQVFGIVLLMLGAYFLESNHGTKFVQNLKDIASSKYVHYIFLASLFYGVSSIMDKYLLGFITPVTYIIAVQFFIAVNFTIMIHLFHNGFSGIKNGIRSAGKYIFLVAIITTSYRLLQAQAVSMAYISLVIPIKKTSTFFSTLIGGTIFHEKDILKKAIACIIMLAGVYLVLQ